MNRLTAECGFTPDNVIKLCTDLVIIKLNSMNYILVKKTACDGNNNCNTPCYKVFEERCVIKTTDFGLTLISSLEYHNIEQ